MSTYWNNTQCNSSSDSFAQRYTSILASVSMKSLDG